MSCWARINFLHKILVRKLKEATWEILDGRITVKMSLKKSVVIL